ncbi:hypothetical protein L8V92_04735 [Campylobacter lari]|nr:hypothetical protein [Campylobacter lari]MCV3421593.1 hypothetical protein [Campylobacter lari]
MKNALFWSKIYSIKHSKLDEDHKRFFLFYLDLENMINEGQYDSVLLKLISNRLLDYITNHCKQEEAYMASIRYPLLESHKRAHNKLIEEFKFIISNLNNKEFVYNELLGCLKKTFLMHIVYEDSLILRFNNYCFDLNEFQFNIEDYEKIIEVFNGINSEKDFMYICSCLEKSTHKICETFHKEIIQNNLVVTCQKCGDPIVFFDMDIDNKEEMSRLKEFVMGDRNV